MAIGVPKCINYTELFKGGKKEKKWAGGMLPLLLPTGYGEKLLLVVSFLSLT